jgi:hypothetical protein
LRTSRSAMASRSGTSTRSSLCWRTAVSGGRPPQPPPPAPVVAPVRISSGSGRHVLPAPPEPPTGKPLPQEPSVPPLPSSFGIPWRVSGPVCTLEQGSCLLLAPRIIATLHTARQYTSPARVVRCHRPGGRRHLRKSRVFRPRKQYALGRPAPPPTHSTDTSVTAGTHFAIVLSNPGVFARRKAERKYAQVCFS